MDIVSGKAYIATISHLHMVAYLRSVVQLHHHFLYSHHFTPPYGGLFTIRGAAAPSFSTWPPSNQPTAARPNKDNNKKHAARAGLKHRKKHAAFSGQACFCHQLFCCIQCFIICTAAFSFFSFILPHSVFAFSRSSLCIRRPI